MRSTLSAMSVTQADVAVNCGSTCGDQPFSLRALPAEPCESGSNSAINFHMPFVAWPLEDMGQQHLAMETQTPQVK